VPDGPEGRGRGAGEPGMLDLMQGPGR